MAKSSNEAKVKFTAETGGFNAALKASRQHVTELRSEVKLADSAMVE